MGMDIGKTDCMELGTRDAFHVPCVMVMGSGRLADLKPGTNVRFVDDRGLMVRKVVGEEKSHAIVDPFVSYKEIKAGKRFWVLLIPNSTSGLRHHYDLTFTDVPHYEEPITIPAIPVKTQEVLDLEARIRELEGTNSDLEAELDNDGCRGCY